MFNKNYFEIIKMISVLILIAIPPWLALVHRIKNKRKRRLIWLLFLPYFIATLFTQNLLPFIAAIIVLYFIRQQNDSEEKYYLRPLNKYKSDVIVLSFIFKFGITIISNIYVNILIKMGYNLETQEVIKLFMKEPWAKVIFLAITTVIFAPILEEFIFRHLLYRGLSKRNKPFAIIFTSLLFTILHYNLAGSLSFFAVGVFNCYLYDKFGYRAAVLNHFVFNFISVALILIAKALNLPQMG